MMSDFAGQDLAQVLARAALDLQAVRGAEATADEACQRAVAVIAGCSCAAISESRRVGGTLLASTDEAVRYVHDAQYDLDEGPLIDAIWRERMIYSDDLAEDPRWPRFAAAATNRGLRSLLIIQLHTRDDTVRALQLFSTGRNAFDEVTRDVAKTFAAHAAVAILSAREHTQLSEALVTRQRIGQATGILAERHDLTTDEAFTLLVNTSQDHNIKLRDLAARFITSEDAARHRNGASTLPPASSR